ncbi:MAG: RrF2 family transcriptional regulator [Clostridia bacterium]|nr:RrF2 family transcriptional regulator [Clostridia bacterium]MBR3553950.1 RrF2 family transcriptional regulator [Clostridia bacterium]
MLVSTKGRYALRVLIDLAEHYTGRYLPMKDVAARQGLSLKYLERIMPLLAKGNLIDAVHGKGGGYRLKKAPGDITVGEILRLTEGSLAPIACLEPDAPVCPRTAECRTIAMWSRFQKMADDFFDGVTLADLVQTDPGDNYVI